MPYSSMEAVNPSIKGIQPPVTLAQANRIAAIADSITGVDSPWAVAIAQFKKSHTVKDGRWVKKEVSEWGAKKELSHGVKALEVNDKQYVVLWTTNAFRDDEGEIFSTKSIEDYVARCDENHNLRGRVWFWHIKGTDYATVVWQGVAGRILVELAEVDNTEYGRKMFHALEHPEEYPELLPQGWGTSHGYVYKRGSKEGGVYNWFHKFESTTLPHHRASNKYGGVQEVIDMGKVTKEKAAGLAAIVGDDVAKDMLGAAEQFSEGLESDVDFKEEAKPAKPVTMEDEEEEEEEEEEEAAVEETKAETKGQDDDGEIMEMELDEELLKEIASHVPVKGVVEKALKELLPKALAEAMAAQATQLTQAVKEAVEATNVASKEEIVKGAVAGTLRLKPYTASAASDNVVSEKDLEDHDNTGSKAAAKGDVVTQLTQRMLQGTL